MLRRRIRISTGPPRLRGSPRPRGLAPLAATVLAALAASAPSAGCAYMGARGRDAAQIVRLDVGGALGFSADTRLAGLFDLGLGGGYTWDAALLYGTPWAGPAAEALAPGLCKRALGPASYFTHKCHSALPPLTGTDRPAHDVHRHLARPIHWFDVEAGAIAGVVHVRFGLSLGELADFLLGWFGADIAGDDAGEPPAPPPGPGLPPALNGRGGSSSPAPRA